MSANQPEFIRQQFAFCAHLRAPAEHPAPAGVEERRIRVYRDLLFNNVKTLLASTFPVLRAVLGEERWSALVRDYFSVHRAHTPLFPQLPSELLRYLENERGERADDPPFLYELAHYEWVELALSIDSRESPQTGFEPEGDLARACPLLSPLAWTLAYRFPVQRISPEFQPDSPSPQPNYILLYRDRADAVHFLELNPVSARLLELLGDNPESRNGTQLLQQIAVELQHPHAQRVINAGLEILRDLRAREVILGTVD